MLAATSWRNNIGYKYSYAQTIRVLSLKPWTGVQLPLDYDKSLQ